MKRSSTFKLQRVFYSKKYSLVFRTIVVVNSQHDHGSDLVINVQRLQTNILNETTTKKASRFHVPLVVGRENRPRKMTPEQHEKL